MAQHGGARPGSGRKKLNPTELQRKQVEKLKLRGLTDREICEIVFAEKPISIDTLRRHFKPELDRAAIFADAEVVSSLFIQAVGAPTVYDHQGRVLRREVSRVPAVGIFWTKARLNWSDQPKPAPIDENSKIVIEGGLPTGPPEPDLPDPGDEPIQQAEPDKPDA